MGLTIVGISYICKIFPTLRIRYTNCVDRSIWIHMLEKTWTKKMAYTVQARTAQRHVASAYLPMIVPVERNDWAAETTSFKKIIYIEACAHRVQARLPKRLISHRYTDRSMLVPWVAPHPPMCQRDARANSLISYHRCWVRHCPCTWSQMGQKYPCGCAGCVLFKFTALHAPSNTSYSMKSAGDPPGMHDGQQHVLNVPFVFDPLKISYWIHRKSKFADNKQARFEKAVTLIFFR